MDTVGRFTIPGGHPSLQGHFPGNPVVPGVVILNEVVELVERALSGKTVTGIKFVKFIKPLRSDMEVVLRVEKNKAGSVGIACEHNERVIVKGRLVLAEKDVA